MDDNAPPENPAKDFNKIDLTQLQGFSFGTQWSQDKTAAREPRRDDRPRRDDGAVDRRDDRGAPERRDRRGFKRPAIDPNAPIPAAPAGPVGGDGARPPRRDNDGDGRPPRREFRGEFRGGPRRDGPGGDRNDRGFNRGAPQERGPYDSPYFTSTFYPEDTSFTALAKTIRASCRTFELFDIAKTVVGKADRFVVVLQRKVPGAGPGHAAEPAAGAARQPLFVSVPDSVPFETEEAAVAHVMSTHLGQFFDTAEVEIDPPKGNFQVVNRCGVTGELLGPPNYHRYSQIVQQHYATKVSRMPFDAFRSRIETVREPEVIAQWIEKMKKTTRYTWKYGRPAESAAKPATETPAAEAAPVDGAAPAPAPAPETPAVLPAATFDTLEDARNYLLGHAKDKVVRSFDNVRFHGKIIESIPNGEIRRAVEGTLERQRRFPLDTANALRGRLRREGFTIFKKGSKGISYVCAVKRKFRVPGQVFSDSIGALIAFIEANPMVKASELPTKFLGIATAPAKPATEAAPADGAAPAPEASAPVLSIDDRAKISRLQGDLTWLVHEGYVTEFIDGRLFAPPVMVEARKKEVEAEEHDPENFPEAPPSDTPAPAAAAPSETPKAPEEPTAPATA